MGRSTGVCSKKYRLLLGVVGLHLLSLTSSSATQLVYSTSIPSTGTGFSIGFNLPAFNSYMGTLDSITFQYSITATGSMTVNNAGAFMGASYGGSLKSVNFLYTPSYVGEGAPPMFDVNISAGGNPPVGSSLFSGSGGASGNVNPDLSTYGNWMIAGGGTLGFNLESNSAFFAGGGPGYSFNSVAMAEGGTFTLTYNFTAVPEPSATGFFAVIAAGLAIIFRRSRLTKFARRPASQNQV
jgi:hypothetical protein